VEYSQRAGEVKSAARAIRGEEWWIGMLALALFLIAVMARA
jgi:hypothetical protein